MRYVLFRGFDKIEAEADSVGLILDNGAEFELQFRKTDKEVSLSTNGKLTIKPVAANVVRLERW